MFDSQVLEVVVGLIFVYVAVSTACSAINELIARAFDMRATTLEDAIRRMLADPNDTITSKLLQSHLIAGTVPSSTKPSYISSQNFALALFDLIAPSKTDQPTTVQGLKNAVSNMPDERVRTALLTLLDSAQQDVDVARQRIENWYDDTMERVSGAYKRRAQIYITIIGVVLCALLNVDTIMIGRELWNDGALRTAILAEAQTQAPHALAAGQCADALTCVSNSIRFKSVPPIGWGGDVRAFPKSSEWTWELIGILISSIAVAMGAPFWFDLLNKIVNLRLTGSPPPDSRHVA